MATPKGRASQLPQEVDLYQQAVPTSAAALTSTDTELESIAITNTTAGSLNLTLTDGNDDIIGNFDEYPISVNTPYVIQFDPPIKFSGGIKWVASGAGLVADVKAWKHPAYSVAN